VDLDSRLLIPIGLEYCVDFGLRRHASSVVYSCLCMYVVHVHLVHLHKAKIFLRPGAYFVERNFYFLCPFRSVRYTSWYTT